MSDADTGSEDSKDSQNGVVPQFLVVNGLATIPLVNGGQNNMVNLAHAEDLDEGKHIYYLLSV